jgi:ATP-dependent RNA helicase RhlE
MSGRDMMGIAQTGTGKTFAYLLPLLKLYKFIPGHTPKIVILVPTRELVVQVVEEVEKLTKYMSVRTVGILVVLTSIPKRLLSIKVATY